MSKLFSPLTFKGKTAPNRIVMPPMVMFGYGDESGLVNRRWVEHYKAHAPKVGLLIAEATCIAPDARLSKDQLGIWSDEFIEGLAKIAAAAHAEEALALLQIHHAGLKSVYEKTAPSDYERNGITARALSLEEIAVIQNQFVQAAVRAQKAGFDGIELHGAHGYLISQFLSPSVNKRSDAYGGSAENCARFAVEVISAIRKACGDDFIIGIRMGANEADSVFYAKAFETAGLDILHASFGMSFSFSEDMPAAPAGFKHNPIVYLASLIKQAVKIPVIAVYGITAPADAADVVESGLADFAAVARSMLVDEHWAAEASEGKETGLCLHCPACFWHGLEGEQRCPGRKLWLRKQAKAS